MDEKSSRHVLNMNPGTAVYVALDCPTREPMQRGQMYRMQVIAHGKGKIGLTFWQIPNMRAPILHEELTDDWKTYSLDFFVESKAQTLGLPVVTVDKGGDIWIDHITLKAVAME